MALIRRISRLGSAFRSLLAHEAFAGILPRLPDSR